MLLTVNIVSHNPAQSSSDNIPSSPPDNHDNSGHSLAEDRGEQHIDKGQMIITACGRKWTYDSVEICSLQQEH